MSAETLPAASVLRPLRFASVWVLLGVLLVLATTVVCLLPNVRGPLPSVNGMDKVDHAIAYLVLTAWFTALLQRRAWLGVVLGLLLFGAGIEVAQELMHLGREGSLADLLADAVGIGLGMAVTLSSRESWFVRIEQWLLPN
jgi:VanZ family protein